VVTLPYRRRTLGWPVLGHTVEPFNPPLVFQRATGELLLERRLLFFFSK
jgi:hypothetical protein